MRQVTAKEFKSAALSNVKSLTMITSWDKPALVVMPPATWEAVSDARNQATADAARLLVQTRTQAEEIKALASVVKAANTARDRARLTGVGGFVFGAISFAAFAASVIAG